MFEQYIFILFFVLSGATGLFRKGTLTVVSVDYIKSCACFYTTLTSNTGSTLSCFNFLFPVSQHWGQELHGAAWHFWRPGYKWANIMNHMVKPTNQQEIYICGEAYSTNFQTWTEGALEVCDVMLSKHFGL